MINRMNSAIIQLLHHKNTSKPSVSAQHMLEGFGRVFEWEFLDHAVDVMDLGEFNRFFAICGKLVAVLRYINRCYLPRAWPLGQPWTERPFWTIAAVSTSTLPTAGGIHC